MMETEGQSAKKQKLKEDFYCPCCGVNKETEVKTIPRSAIAAVLAADEGFAIQFEKCNINLKSNQSKHARTVMRSQTKPASMHVKKQNILYSPLVNVDSLRRSLENPSDLQLKIKCIQVYVLQW